MLLFPHEFHRAPLSDSIQLVLSIIIQFVKSHMIFYSNFNLDAFFKENVCISYTNKIYLQFQAVEPDTSERRKEIDEKIERKKQQQQQA